MNPNIGINFSLCIFLSPLLCSSSPQETYLYLAEPLSPLTRAKGGEFLFFLERSHIWQWISAYLPWVYIWLHCWRVSEWIVKPISSYPDEKLPSARGWAATWVPTVPSMCARRQVLHLQSGWGCYTTSFAGGTRIPCEICNNTDA